jgi:hypothetical protein
MTHGNRNRARLLRPVNNIVGRRQLTDRRMHGRDVARDRVRLSLRTDETDVDYGLAISRVLTMSKGDADAATWSKRRRKVAITVHHAYHRCSFNTMRGPEGLSRCRHGVCAGEARDPNRRERSAGCSVARHGCLCSLPCDCSAHSCPGISIRTSTSRTSRSLQVSGGRKEPELAELMRHRLSFLRPRQPLATVQNT